MAVGFAETEQRSIGLGDHHDPSEHQGRNPLTVVTKVDGPPHHAGQRVVGGQLGDERKNELRRVSDIDPGRSQNGGGIGDYPKEVGVARRG